MHASMVVYGWRYNHVLHIKLTATQKHIAKYLGIHAVHYRIKHNSKASNNS